MKTLLATLLLFSFAVQGAEKSPCYTGKFSLSVDRVQLKYQIKENVLHVEVLNPNDVITLSNGEQMTVGKAFDPGPDMKLVPLDGVKCPACLALQTENGHFNYIIERLGDGTKQATMNYFGYRTGRVESQSCDEDQSQKK